MDITDTVQQQNVYRQKKIIEKKQYNKRKVNVQIRFDSPQSGQGNVQV